jgi:serine phosphatase RsbU (regulator of sigma subunit)
VLRGAGPLLITDIPPLGQARSPLDARQLELFEQLGGTSAIMAPLRTRREVLGALTLVRTREEHPFTKQDVRALVLGEVAGHDLKAAVAMSSLRNMLRGIATECQGPPGTVLGHLDHACQTLYPYATATCVYALIKGGEEGPRELHLSSAGHPPPLLTTQEGETRYLDGGAGLLIGVDPDLDRPTARERLPLHSTLLLFTDGLIERRGEALDQGLVRLRRHTATLAQAPLDVFCDELVLALGADNTDDIALLAARPSPGAAAT